MFFNTPLAKSVSTEHNIVSENHDFVVPVKLIKTANDMKTWDHSEAYFEYLGFILAVNEAIKGKSNTQGSKTVSEPVSKVVDLLNTLDEMIENIPPVKQPQRFGNQAFRIWYKKLKDDALDLLQGILPDDLYRSVPEIMVYLIESFGNSTRIDYGTGHEMAFIMFLCCLYKIGFLKNDDKMATGCKIFTRYLELARKLQKVYRMEPAGSHGVWSLDDYQFVPFIWGSSQLVANPHIEPRQFLDQNVLNDYSNDYMFISCIQYINEVKTGPFAEHSNQLWSISDVSTWSKINSGLIKMYKAEVLGKFPVVQHVYFGSLLTLNATPPNAGLVRPKISLTPFSVASRQVTGILPPPPPKLLSKSDDETTLTKSSKSSEEVCDIIIATAASSSSSDGKSRGQVSREFQPAMEDGNKY